MTRKPLALASGLMGLVFFAQGAGLFTPGSSFMNHNPTWAVIGVVMAILGLVLWPRSQG